MLEFSCLRVICYIILINNPQRYIFLLIFQTFLVSLLLILVRRVWLAYVLFLVFLGGVLVIFIYIRRLASTIIVKSWFYKIKNFFLFIITLILILSYLDTNFFLFREVFTEKRIIYSLISNWNFILYLFVINYLLIALFNIFRTLKVFKGPLRKYYCT